MHSISVFQYNFQEAGLNSSAKRATSIGPCQFPESDDDAVITTTEVYITDTGAKKEIVTENESFYTKSAHPNGLYKINDVRDIKDYHTGNGFVTGVHETDNELPQNGFVITDSYSLIEKNSGDKHKPNGEVTGCNGFHDVKF